MIAPPESLTSLPPALEERFQRVVEYYRGYLEEIGEDYLYQLPAIAQLALALHRYGGALDASDTGTGKTAVACAVARVLDRELFVICPKNVVPPWERMADQFRVSLTIINYEMLRTGRTPYGQWIVHPPKIAGKKPWKEFIFDRNVSRLTSLVVFDECQKLKDYSTLNCAVGVAALQQTFDVLALSATAADNPMHMKFIALLCGLIQHPTHFWGWMLAHGVKRIPLGRPPLPGRPDRRRRMLSFNGSKQIMSQLHSKIFPAHGARIRVADLGDRFPHSKLISEAYAMENAEAIQKVYATMRAEIAELRRTSSKDRGANILTAQLRARQEIELLRIPLFIQMTEEGKDQGMSVAIMLNFDSSIKALARRINCTCHVTGAVTGDQRQENIDAFNSDLERVIILNLRAGGIGIGLHGTPNGNVRLGLISPTFSAIDLKQAVGRFPRAGGARSIVKILWASGTVEEEANEKVRARIARVSILNDNELDAWDKILRLE